MCTEQLQHDPVKAVHGFIESAAGRQRIRVVFGYIETNGHGDPLRLLPIHQWQAFVMDQSAYLVQALPRRGRDFLRAAQTIPLHCSMIENARARDPKLSAPSAMA